MKCEICNVEVKDDLRSLRAHIQHRHKDYDGKKYYDEFLKTSSGEGICPVCDEETNFNSLSKGYYIYHDPCKYKSKDVLTAVVDLVRTYFINIFALTILEQ